MPFETFLQSHGVKYSVQRSNLPIREETGLPDKGHIGFMPDVDVKAGDILTNPNDDTYHITKVEMQFFHGAPHYLQAFYQIEQELNAAKQSSAPVFNIQNAYGSVIGTGNQATINYNSAISGLKRAVSSDTSADKEQLEKIVSLLEMVVNDQVPPSKGLFSKFRDVMDRNSWINAVPDSKLPL